MSKSHKFFRYVWRIDAILILVGTAVIAVGSAALLVPEIWRSTHRRDAVIVNTGNDGTSSVPLELGHTYVVTGTVVLRANLETRREGKGFSSGDYSETRNILFIDPDQKSGRWLLPDNEHVIEDSSDIVDKPSNSASRTIATAIVVRPTGESSKAGRILLFDPTGKKVVEVAKDATQIHLATLSGNDIVLLFGRNNHLVRSTFDPESLTRHTEQEIEIPKLK